MSKKWKPNEITYLKRYAAGKRIADLAQRFDTDHTEIKAKLAELGLMAKDSVSDSRLAADDPLLVAFEKGLKAVYKERWQEAEKQFTKVAAGDVADLSARARQFLTVCRARAGSEDDAKTDRFARAVYFKNRGEIAEALAECKRQKKPDERFVYLEASLHALAERSADAKKALARAIEMNPENRVHAFHDPDFEPLRQDDEFAQLFELS